MYISIVGSVKKCEFECIKIYYIFEFNSRLEYTVAFKLIMPKTYPRP